MSVAAASGLVMLAVAVIGVGGSPLILGALWFLLLPASSPCPTPRPGVTRHGEAATGGPARGVQFVIGETASPLIGAMGSDSAVPMALVMACTAGGAALVSLFTLRVAVVRD